MKMAVPPGSRRNQLTRRECVVAALHSAMSCAVIRACPFGHLSACYEIDHASNGLLRTTTRVSLNFKRALLPRESGATPSVASNCCAREQRSVTSYPGRVSYRDESR